MLLMKSRFVNKTIKKYYARPFNQNSNLENVDICFIRRQWQSPTFMSIFSILWKKSKLTYSTFLYINSVFAFSTVKIYNEPVCRSVSWLVNLPLFPKRAESFTSHAPIGAFFLISTHAYLINSIIYDIGYSTSPPRGKYWRHANMTLALN